MNFTVQYPANQAKLQITERDVAKAPQEFSTRN